TGTFRYFVAPGPAGVDAHLRALARDAGAFHVCRIVRTRHRHTAGRLHRLAARFVAVAFFSDGVAGGRFAAHVSHRHFAHPHLCSDAECAAFVRPRRDDAPRMVDYRPVDHGWPALADHAHGNAGPVAAHTDHAIGAGGDAGSAA